MATEVQLARARAWLHRHRLGDIEPSALLVAKLEARWRGTRINVVTAVAFFGIIASWSAIDGRSRSALSPDETDLSGLAWFVLSNVVLILAMCLGLWHQRRAERKLMPVTRTRSAHPTAAGAARVLGIGHLTATAVVYGGGLLLGAATALLASRPADRALALAFLVAVAVLATLGWLMLAAVLQRPSVAEDSASLLVDDVLRTLDARAAVTPFPVVVALVAAIGSAVGSWLIWSLFGYAVIGTVFWWLAGVSARHCAPELTRTGS